MKNLISIAFLLFYVLSFAQQDDVPIKKHEVKANAFNIIIFKTVDFSYEYLIDSESSFGVSLLVNLQNNDSYNSEYDYYEDDGPYYIEQFAITPFYRRYFSSKYAWGFFLEAFGMFNVQEDYYYNNNNFTSDGSSNNVAVGISIGGKFISSKGFVFEFFGGAGRNLYQSDKRYATEIVPRLGASLGYRW